MKIVKMEEIEKLYTDCHLKLANNQSIRTSLNFGSLTNGLNSDCDFANRNPISLNYNNVSNLDKEENAFVIHKHIASI